MKLFILTFITLASQSAFAAPSHYQLMSKIFVDGKLVSSPRMNVNAGEPAEIRQDSQNPKSELRLKVVASDVTNENLKNGILMKFDVSYVANGRTTKASPQILARTGEIAAIEVRSEDGTPAVKLEVTATRL